MLCGCSVCTYLIYVFIGGMKGGLIAIGIFLLILLFLCRSGVSSKDVSSTLLMDILLIASPLFIFWSEPKMIPFFLLTGLDGALCLIYWFVRKGYEGKTPGTLLREEFRLPAFMDLILILWIVNDGIEDRMYPYPLFWIILALPVIDLIRNVLSGRWREM